ncbi:heart- and neural crest derivatives-expressed protein 1 isoform X1 [Xenopus laevis]|uniref:Heart- and neural crest derivatives-expressed protein 1 n=3 Tax=Xenopus laevis TaxID=8355 RepID=HAND1_XENLA|nr:heart- and neural crest derivatives-expressed protein 1 [Xenopus laevis]XP_041440792.1 heart- and neural crest derivatives-expressed protein 1 isoform X1 [Xenopus laevis]O73615.1 RecName: Full=Heart- and neural crest derivatives-expressed protein 1; AltName: Full=Extraembryonic tissues, heart, autonomic nervous system and neural crest derivatives-expressed protein 1; Short=eHAND [Xenopus laevis]AAI70186.1 Heart and neural crest derivatives expressed 1 [Xenopus laevis]AAI70190.1 Heart and neu
MNLIGSYQHHHHHMMPDPFIFSPGSRCHQERPYFQGWVLNPGEVSPEFPAQPPYSPEYGAVVGPSQTSGRIENLGGKLGRRKGAPPKKERRRTESINSAFAELRECIPNVPADTKLSKIKTLRLATSYIGYLMDVLAKDSEPGGTEAFKAEIKKVDGKRRREPQPTEGYWGAAPAGEKKLKGRTGWPQQVWALELNP